MLTLPISRNRKSIHHQKWDWEDTLCFSLNKAEMSQLKKAVLLSTVRSLGKHIDAALNSSTYLSLTKI